MFPLIGGLLSGVSSLVGGIFQSKTAKENTAANIQAQQLAQSQTQEFNAEQAQLGREFNSAEAEKAREFSSAEAGTNRAFQEQMSSTAYQRARSDMEKAGLNPMMMFGSGSAASAPSGAQGTASAASSGAASSSTPNMGFHNAPSALAGLSNAVGQAVNTAINVKTIDKLQEEIANLQVQQARTAAETRTEEQRPSLVRAETATTRAREHQVITETAREGNRMPQSRLEGKVAQDVLDMPEWLRSILVQSAFGGRKIDDVISPITSSARAVSGMRRAFGDRWSDFYR